MVDPNVLRRSKDLATLWKTLSNFSNNQAKLIDMMTDDVINVYFDIKPNDGPYEGGTFKFQMNLEPYPANAPSVTCITPIYHPNIDYFEERDNVCLNIIQDEWQSSLTLEDVVHGVLFLLHHPNLEDPLSPWFEPDMPEDEYLDNVRISLRGGEVEGVVFKRNYCDVGNAVAEAKQCNTIQFGTEDKIGDIVQIDDVELTCDAIICDEMNCDETKCDVIKCDVTKCDVMKCDAMKCDETKRDGISYDEIRYDEMKCNATKYIDSECDEMECTVTKCDTMKCDAMKCVTIECDVSLCNATNYATQYDATSCDASCDVTNCDATIFYVDCGNIQNTDQTAEENFLHTTNVTLDIEHEHKNDDSSVSEMNHPITVQDMMLPCMANEEHKVETQDINRGSDFCTGTCDSSSMVDEREINTEIDVSTDARKRPSLKNEQLETKEIQTGSDFCTSYLRLNPGKYDEIKKSKNQIVNFTKHNWLRAIKGAVLKFFVAMFRKSMDRPT